MATWSCDQQVCSSCRYWQGNRDIDFTGSHYDASDSEAMCANPRGGFRGCIMGDGSSCDDWECF